MRRFKRKKRYCCQAIELASKRQRGSDVAKFVCTGEFPPNAFLVMKLYRRTWRNLLWHDKHHIISNREAGKRIENDRFEGQTLSSTLLLIHHIKLG